MFDYSKLRGRIIEKCGSIEKFADAVGVSMTTMSLKLNNKAGISREDIITWAKILDIDISEYGVYFFTLKV